MTPEQREMIEKHGIITLYGGIDPTSAEYLLQAIAFARDVGHDNDPIAIYFASYGGEVPAGVAMVSAIMADGNVDGVMVGDTASAAGWVWAACKRRYISPYASLGLHLPGRTLYTEGKRENSMLIKRLAAEYDAIEQFVAGIFSSASRMPVEWWLGAMREAEPHEAYIPAAQLIGPMDMCDLWSNRQVSWRGKEQAKPAFPAHVLMPKIEPADTHYSGDDAEADLFDMMTQNGKN